LLVLLSECIRGAALDKVYTVTDYYDGPRAGVAEFRGQPHYYECQFDETSDNWSDTFLLRPIDSETFKLALEDWDIWERWNVAREAEEVDLDTSPALPEERERHNQIAEVLKELLKADSKLDIKAKGQFDVVAPKREGQSIASLVVRWTVVT
jgi:hypothetical protein